MIFKSRARIKQKIKKAVIKALEDANKSFKCELETFAARVKYRYQSKVESRELLLKILEDENTKLKNDYRKHKEIMKELEVKVDQFEIKNRALMEVTNKFTQGNQVFCDDITDNITKSEKQEFKELDK